ncbi:CocE/NonD family hydrolase [Spirosoma radiotolerans]|uniref:X-Pro dipeptidyl-peptidase n=1 Tax=Spirosoma radiotolerans TaxID=1379870 RepID=A0A0E3VAM5_9BACT|nr:CocE/NonD family hydrolase [Spirosoma radiotolerans]AKD58336.1 X-Pro dipeptidyl-peptidase [Spirosoma radiotolerans]
MNYWLYAFLVIALTLSAQAQQTSTSSFVRDNYQKTEYKIPMRDGTKLHTTVYVPKDASKTTTYPFLMQRTCYSVAPYGADAYPAQLGPSQTLMRDKFIFVYQDVRGRWASEGTWTNMTPTVTDQQPAVAAKGKKKASVPISTTAIDESSDTYDTIDWLLKNVPNNNGRVGQWGISYPGFYTAASLPNAHPALKAASPQAPVSDFFFDDFHHNGAFIQAYLFTFPVFGVQHPEPTTKPWYNDQMIKTGSNDGFQWQYDLGPLKNADKYYKDNFYWQETVNHPNYDEFWQKRSIIPHLKNVRPAVMTVGGWFDAEDLYGPLNIYKTVEKNNPNTYNTLVMGPFGHGRWSRETGHTLHSNIYFGDSIATFYQRNIEAKFFTHFLKGAGDGKTGLPEAYLFNTGRNEWKTFDKWPVADTPKMQFFLMSDGTLANNRTMNTTNNLFSEFISDPMKPVPYTEDITTTQGFTPFNYMSEDQRFAGRRPDVLTFQTDVLTEDMTLGGEIMAKLKVSTTGTDADWVVKLIDVYPPNEPNHPYMPNKNITLGNYQQMVRSEAMRGRFRNSFEKPEPFKAGEITDVNFRLQDVLHTFKKGHRVMIQVQSTWFPLIDRNPQKYVDNIYKADAADFQKATHRVYDNSVIEVQVLK